MSTIDLNLSFDYLNLCCLFKSEPIDNHAKARLKPIEMSKRACFNAQFDRWGNWDNKLKVQYTIRLFRDSDYVKDDDYNNYCILSKQEVLDHMEYINKNVHEIDYSVDDTSDSIYDLSVTIDGNRTQHKFILTWVRHLYEFPFTMFLIDSLKLKNQVPEFEDQSLFNLCQLVGTAYSTRYHWYRTDQCLCLPRKQFMTFDEIKKGLDNSQWITGIWKNLLPGRVIRRIHSSDVYKLSWWLNEESFKTERLSIYKHNLKQYLL